MLKFASTQILEAVMGGESLLRTAHRHSFRYEPREGYLYVRSRAISSRCNDNFDEFPSEEIAKSYRTFVGKPVFVNHANANHRRARGVIIDAALHEDRNADSSPDTWAEVLQEVDAKTYPKLADAILKRKVARTSMGCDVEHSICSVCGNKATTPAEYCAHIPRAKGTRFYRHTASGNRVSQLVYESCYGLRFFENSLLVEPPADPTAFVLGVDASGLDKRASRAPRRPLLSDAEGLLALAYGEIKAPADVDTLREESCPVCGDSDTYDGQQCRICGFISPPDQFRDPDLDAAKRMELRKQVVDPSEIDDNGQLQRVDGTGDAMPQDGTAPDGSDPMAAQDPTDPLAAPGQPDVVTQDAIGQDGQVLGPSPIQGENLDGDQGMDGKPMATDADGDGVISPDEIDPDGGVLPPEQGGQAGPRELPFGAQDRTGQPFTPGPDMPERPGEPDGPEDGEELMDESQGEMAPAGAPQGPGTPGDGIPDLTCPACGFGADATPPMTQNTSAPDMGADGIVAGDVCPNCQKAQLMTAGELQGADSTPPPVAPQPRI